MHSLLGSVQHVCWCTVAGKCLGPITSGALLQTQTNGVGDRGSKPPASSHALYFRLLSLFSWLLPQALLQLQNIKHCCLISPYFFHLLLLRTPTFHTPPTLPPRPILLGSCPPIYFTPKYFSHQYTASLVFKFGFDLETYLPFALSSSPSSFTSLMEY